ncbi:hypothetical protein BDN72DRAFT_959363 [Pluteus cervinus]|uniref:Uncharacterized protein n=1 Tax=Pluteus cervinus TaxID=181527 RepID=A0ACD3AWM9_9AGAR|nr:hypothetical protein BDN72DRAFT_959363 [Pluteus cervinus]
MFANSLPRLPPELEQMIFTIALHDDLENIKSLILVAKRVNQWYCPRLPVIDRYRSLIFCVVLRLIPQIYRTVTIHGTVRKTNPSAQSLVYLGSHVRHLMIWRGFRKPPSLGLCLSSCPNLESLAVWTPVLPYDLEAIDNLLKLRLTYLSFNFGEFLNGPSREGRAAIPITFPSTTHLEIIGRSPLADLHKVKEWFPVLTHLALFARGNDTSSVQGTLELFQNQIQVLIYEVGSALGPSPEILPTSVCFELDDPRVVVLKYGYGVIDSWIDGTRGGSLSVWRVAEETVKSRRLALKARVHKMARKKFRCLFSFSVAYSHHFDPGFPCPNHYQ